MNTLKNTLAVFFDSKPYGVSTRRDQSRRLIYYVSRVRPTPTSFATITADIIQNLRSGLDHLAQQLYLVGTGGTTPSRHVYFPIAVDATTYQSLRPARVRGMRRDAVNTLNAIEPYRGGKGHDLWVLHELNIIDKHRLLLTVGSAYQSFNVGAHMRPVMEMQARATGLPVPPKIDVYLRPADTLCPLKVGDELLVDAVDAAVSTEMDFRFNLSLNEPGIAEGPLLDTLQLFCDSVSKTVLLFKSCLS
jgi:hypothetical protein